jgi:ATP-dependent Clp protease ATP-binding subunit ClpC
MPGKMKILVVAKENHRMSQQLTDRARHILQLAREEARQLNHDYVGTEHVLLGLIAEDSSVAAHLLRAQGVEANTIRRGVESLVQRGTQPVTSSELTLTPRAKQAIEYAHDEALAVNQKRADAEHLLLGLMREPDGVAGQLLQTFGIKPQELRAEALRSRLHLMKIVERAVRPVRACIAQKRKMREELFAHLTAIYEQELTRLHDSATACVEATRRFGESRELAEELQSALPRYESIRYFMERWIRYRAPESAARYALRLAGYTFVLLAAILGLVTLGIYLGYGWIEDVKTLARVLGAIVLLTPPAQFVVTLLYIKLRDAMWGAFGNRKSLARVLACTAFIAAVAEFYLMGVAGVARSDLSVALEAARLGGLIGVISGIAFVVLAYFNGQSEIRDSQWALLDIAD